MDGELEKTKGYGREMEDYLEPTAIVPHVLPDNFPTKFQAHFSVLGVVPVPH